MGAFMASSMKAMDDENRRLKKMIAQLGMQNELLKEALGKEEHGHLNTARWPKWPCAMQPNAPFGGLSSSAPLLQLPRALQQSG